ncbi:WAT1-related protein [Striga hermonthica]|uniref:WAT1-related protein n=1 Tax=Striga hermonthica TaxID=68872 RepID=A0A9N7NHE0_STRHE|nr:WAT1-related protein [Striga hermonthica]
MEGDLMPFLTMVVVQLGYAGMNIISKLAMDSGMNPFVQVAYRQIFATVAIAPFAYFVERKTRPNMTLSIFFQIFLCSILGVTVNQITYFVGLKNSTPTIACALSNINPAVTFIMALPFGLEKLGLKSKAGQAKVFGTLVCVGGAILVSFYHGPIVNIGQSSIHWKYAETTTSSASPTAHLNFILGPFLLLVSAISWAAWLIIQTRVSQKYGCPYSSSALMCLMASVQCVIVAFCFDHTLSAWSLRSSIRIVSSIYSGIVCSALAFGLMSWCIERKGPLYVSMFSPLLLVIVAILSWALLNEKLYAGTLVGSSLIVLGLYGVLWGKKREMINLKDDNGNIQELGGDHEKGNRGVDADYDLESLSTTNVHGHGQHKTEH